MKEFAVITGAYGGLGRALAHCYSKAGYGLILLGRKQEKLESLKGEFPDHTTVFTLQADVRNLDACLDAYREIQKENLIIKVLINNAGVTYIKRFDDHFDMAQYQKVIETNLNGPVNITRCFLEDLLANRGTLINISSVLGYAPLIGRTAYVASKFGLEGFSQVLRVETEGRLHLLMVYPTFFVSDIRNEVLGDKTVNEVLTADHVAARILEAHKKQMQQLYIGRTAKLSYYLSKYSPKLYVHLMRKKAGVIG
jgi:short-subunit dehydrogenase